MSISKTCNSIFQQVIDDYHLQDFVQAKKLILIQILNYLKK